MTVSRICAAVGIIVAFGAAWFGVRLHGKWAAARARRGPHVTQKVEAVQLSRGELLKRMTKEQAINLVQNILRTLEQSSSSAPDIPATKIRMERLLEELKRS